MRQLITHRIGRFHWQEMTGVRTVFDDRRWNFSGQPVRNLIGHHRIICWTQHGYRNFLFPDNRQGPPWTIPLRCKCCSLKFRATQERPGLLFGVRLALVGPVKPIQNIIVEKRLPPVLEGLSRLICLVYLVGRSKIRSPALGLRDHRTFMCHKWHQMCPTIG
ncbi:MAG: Uncharacterised protein [Hyphomonas sp. TMED17]|nr:MAG: Uncharacterised protein [Hyphomonas sp. TMED17]